MTEPILTQADETTQGKLQDEKTILTNRLYRQRDYEKKLMDEVASLQSSLADHEHRKQQSYDRGERIDDRAHERAREQRMKLDLITGDGETRGELPELRASILATIKAIEQLEQKQVQAETLQSCNNKIDPIINLNQQHREDLISKLNEVIRSIEGLVESRTRYIDSYIELQAELSLGKERLRRVGANPHSLTIPPMVMTADSKFIRMQILDALRKLT